MPHTSDFSPTLRIPPGAHCIRPRALLRVAYGTERDSQDQNSVNSEHEMAWCVRENAEYGTVWQAPPVCGFVLSSHSPKWHTGRCLGHVYKRLNSSPAPNPRVSGPVHLRRLRLFFYPLIFPCVDSASLITVSLNMYLGLKWGERGRKKRVGLLRSFWFHSLFNISRFHLIFKLLLQIIFSTTLSLLHKCISFIFIYCITPAKL